MPLDGHGLAYFEELTVAYRTIPPADPTKDPWSRAATQASRAAQVAVVDLAEAVKLAGEAQAAATAAPDDATLKAASAEKADQVIKAREKLDEANNNAASATSAVAAKFAAATIIEDLLRKKELLDRKMPGGSLWSDILIFESALLRLAPFETLKTKLLSLRQEYREVMGAAAASVMAPSYLDLKEIKEEKDFLRVQAEAANLMDELHWHYVSAPRLEWYKTRTSIALAGYTAIVCTLLLLCSLRSGPTEPGDATCCQYILSWFGSLHFNCSTLSLVMLAGAVGAALSAFQRIQNGGTSAAALLNLRNSRWQSLSIGVAPAIGALFALLLTLIFAGGIISGNIFPKVTLRTDECGTNQPPVAGAPPVKEPTPVIGPVVPGPAAPPAAAVPPNNPPPGADTLPTSLSVAKKETNNPTPGGDTNGNDKLSKISKTLTNNPAATNTTADPATWRDGKNLCEHRWYFASGADLALLLLWAFIAGFSERLVPDMLTRLAKKGEEKV